MLTPLSVSRENELLARELGYEYGHPRYKWVHSSSLTMPMVITDDTTGAVLYDYHCICGIGVSVHRVDCKFTLPKPRWEMRNLVPESDDQWILCRWLPPGFDKEEWESTFGGVPYPASGYFFPVGDPQKCIKLPSGQVPFRPTTELCIAAIKEHFSKTARQRSAEQREKWDKNSEHFREETRLRCIDAFPVHEGYPGEKHGWSHGGLPEVESPNVRTAKTDSEPLVTLT